ncbi:MULTISPECIES: putative porin [Olivibacter]|uniref:Porin n=2 Tax=Sphingobacteriaceae TaxID=84566 RepID=F4C378_SPHS2|nr:putative porin [Olivibacter sp. UJ_SKK_5.1]MDX3917308.1 putative porin [Pseudosphingobacterium sp.]
MIKHLRACFFLFVLCLFAGHSFAQEQEEWGADLDSLRRAEEAQQDSIIYNASYIRYTTLDRLKQGTFTVPLDTTLKGFQYYNPQTKPKSPTMNLGNYGLATRDLLFSPTTEIGFRTGFTAMDRYLLTLDSIRFYRARSPFSELYFVTGDQVFSAKIGQNIKPNWSVGANFNASLARGFYQNQRYNDIQPAIYTWYESPNLRYNLQSALIFNTLVATENGSILNDSIFRVQPENSNPESFEVRLSQQREQRPRNTWTDHSFFLRQSMFIGRLDTLNKGTQEQQVLPTMSVAHSLKLNRKKYKFFKNEADPNGALPFSESVLTNDSTMLTTITNDFVYSFSLRGKSVSFIKNEVKLDLGLQHDLMFYKQGRDSLSVQDTLASNRYRDMSFQNITLKAGLGYRFSDRVNITTDFRQIITGRNFGDFHYGAQANLLYNNTVGRLVLAGYFQNQSPEYLAESVNYTYHKWDNNDRLDKIKTTNLSAAYENPRFRFLAKAEYFLINNYTYYKEVDNPDHRSELLRVIEVAQHESPINLLKLTLGKDFTFFDKLHFDNYVVYQKSDYNDILMTPEFYTWHSFYYNTILVKVINLNIGFDIRFNTPYVAPAYAINIGQFYRPYYGGVDANGNEITPIEFSSYPIVDPWVTATLKRTNFFLRYDNASQGLFSRGYYTVRRYPMAPAGMRFGVSWKFYD